MSRSVIPAIVVGVVSIALRGAASPPEAAQGLPASTADEAAYREATDAFAARGATGFLDGPEGTVHLPGFARPIELRQVSALLEAHPLDPNAREDALSAHRRYFAQEHALFRLHAQPISDELSRRWSRGTVIVDPHACAELAAFLDAALPRALHALRRNEQDLFDALRRAAGPRASDEWLLAVEGMAHRRAVRSMSVTPARIPGAEFDVSELLEECLARTAELGIPLADDAATEWGAAVGEFERRQADLAMERRDALLAEMSRGLPLHSAKFMRLATPEMDDELRALGERVVSVELAMRRASDRLIDRVAALLPAGESARLRDDYWRAVAPVVWPDPGDTRHLSGVIETDASIDEPLRRFLLDMLAAHEARRVEIARAMSEAFLDWRRDFGVRMTEDPIARDRYEAAMTRLARRRWTTARDLAALLDASLPDLAGSPAFVEATDDLRAWLERPRVLIEPMLTNRSIFLDPMSGEVIAIEPDPDVGRRPRRGRRAR